MNSPLESPVKMYVACFLFMGPEVLLLKKTQPAWQAGLLNGVGGKVEEGEGPFDAARREWREETGDQTAHDWQRFCTEFGPGYRVDFFKASVTTTTVMTGTKNDVGEELRWTLVGHVGVSGLQTVGNLSWLIPAAKDWRRLDIQVRTADDIMERPRW